MTYDEMLKVFNYNRRDFSFPSSALDNLNDQERKTIETLIVKSVLNGESFCLKHIDHLKFYNPVEIFSNEIIDKFDSNKKVNILRILYKMTKDDKYIDLLVKISMRDSGAYSMLTIMYEDNEINPKYLNTLIKLCKFNIDNNSYIKMLGRIIPKEKLEELGIKPIVRLHDEYGINHDQELYSMVTKNDSNSDFNSNNKEK